MSLDASFRHADLISKERRVRTAAGARFFGKPIGSLITEGEYEAAKARHNRLNAAAKPSRSNTPAIKVSQVRERPAAVVTQGHHAARAAETGDFSRKMWFKDTGVTPQRWDSKAMAANRNNRISDKRDFPRVARQNMGKPMAFVFLGRRGHERRTTDMRLVSGTLAPSSRPDFYTLDTPQGSISVRFSHLTYMIPGGSSGTR